MPLLAPFYHTEFGKNSMPVQDLNIFAHYDKQRFVQYGCMDSSNWYKVSVPTSKKKEALYPAMGRRHVSFMNTPKLVFDTQPRVIFKTVNYFYVVVSTQVYQCDRFYNQKLIGHISLSGTPWFDFLSYDSVTYAILTDEQHAYIITESGTNVTMEVITDSNAPAQPQYVAQFGNRFVVSNKGTPNYFITQIGLTGGASGCFSFTSGVSTTALFNRASGVIGQICALNGQLYILCDYTTDIWANIPTQITVGDQTREFPFKLNSSYNWNFGIADPNSLGVGFGVMAWLARNSDGLVEFIMSDGQSPKQISTQAINVLLQQNYGKIDALSPFLTSTTFGFLYQYEDTVFYRASAGRYNENQFLSLEDNAESIEFNTNTQTWHRVTELNGGRNRIENHVFFNNIHLVTVQQDPVIYQMAGNIYYNETYNAVDGTFNKFPMRYELITQHIYQPDYSEFITDYIEIDFVFGVDTFIRVDAGSAPPENSRYLVAENSTSDNPIYIVTEDGKYIIADDNSLGVGSPETVDDLTYSALYKPHVELYYSDDGSETFLSADVREFSQLGVYSYRMRWYELGSSRNRCYKLVCVSPSAITILGAAQNIRRSSGGAN